MIDHQRDMTPVVDLRRKKGTGAERTQRPIYVDLLPPCNHACPAGENIQAWLDLAQAGRWKEAWEQLITNKPLPAVHGRVCYHPCETACNRRELDGAVSIHAVERFLGDLALSNAWKVPVTAQPSGKRVLVVGAGPGGAVCSVSSQARRSRRRNPRCWSAARRDAAFWHPRVPASARRSHGRDQTHRRLWRQDRSQ